MAIPSKTTNREVILKKTKHIGAIGEAFAKYRLTVLGYKIFSPDIEDSEYDFIAVQGNVLIPIQVKTTEHVINDTMLFNFRKTRSNTQKNFSEKYYNKIVFILVCLENSYIGCTITKQSCLRIRLNNPKTINQFSSNRAVNYELTVERLLSCVETLRVAPKS